MISQYKARRLLGFICVASVALASGCGATPAVSTIVPSSTERPLPSPTIATVSTAIQTPTREMTPSLNTSVAGPSPTMVSQPSATAIAISTPTSLSTPTVAPTRASELLTSTRLLKDDAQNMSLAEAQGLVKEGSTVQLARQPEGRYSTDGVLTSPLYATDFPFDNVVLSWNAEAPAGSQLRFQLRAGDGQGLSPWFTMGTWSASGGASETGQGNAWGDVDVDTLELLNPATQLQYRVVFSTGDPAVSPRLRSVAVVYADTTRPLAGPKPDVLAGWARDLDVPQYSQLEQNPAIARQICSPTSLAMVLNYWGSVKSVAEVAQGVLDARARIFGNWPLNTAYAGALGFDTYVTRFYSIEQLQNEIAQGRPAVISIHFAPGQLDNSPIDSTTGHLIVVRGFTPDGDVVVNDPIAPSSSTVRRIYGREQLTKVWLDSGGIVYVIKPGTS